MNPKGYPAGFKLRAEFAWFDGDFIPWEEARIHVDTPAFAQGFSVFEGIRSYWNDTDQQIYIFHLREHLNRLFNSMKMMRITLPFSKTELFEASVELVRRDDESSSSSSSRGRPTALPRANSRQDTSLSGARVESYRCR